MAQAKIRGEPDDHTRMVLGQLRKIFDPRWIQSFETGKILISFYEEPDCKNELKNFMEMYGYTLCHTEFLGHYRYKFK